MEQSYKYFAFISFRSSDAREAVRLQHAIERYRLPAVLCRENKSVPRRITPLYCYINDMHAGEELMQELKARMEQSRYLIVLCSPDAAKSVYINSGIDYFVSLGRRDSIIPVIVDGVPYSNDPAAECFPEALKRHFPKHPDPLQDHSILGINLHEQGVSRREAYNRAMLMVVARMLQLDFDGLLLRDNQRRRKRTIALSAVSLLIVAALCLTWLMAQTVDVAIGVHEATPPNEALPPCGPIALRLTINNEQKSDTIPSIGANAVLRHIPPQYIGRDVRVELSATDYIPLDTTLVLQRALTLPLRRDAQVYGRVRFRCIGSVPPSMQIGPYTVQPDPHGTVEIDIPVAEQRTAYPVTTKNYTDTIYMPCGEDAVLVLP